MSKRIMIAGDEEPIRSAISKILERAGYETSKACNTHEVLDCIKVRNDEPDPIDVLLLDVQMPGRTGPEVMAELAKAKNAPSVIFMTGAINTAPLKELESNTCCGVLIKPFTAKRLLGLIDETFQNNS